MKNQNHRPRGELLLPVGDKDMCLAAIHNGADAVYIGMPGFNARGRARDHSLEELKEMVDMCHLYGVHVHVAFNVLIFEAELERALELLKEVIPMGIDAFIVQDLGLVQLIGQLAPEQVIHGSTQMTITNELAIDLLADLDISRFVLGREVSLSEMKKIREKTTKELEVFVHGALCVAYSGQCFTSEAIGGRSANRGQCAQSCRLDYDLIVDGKVVGELDRNYVVSPKDLFGLEQIDELLEIGIDSFKVEGRLKGPQYVSSVGRLYKSKMDRDSDFSLGLTKSDLERTYSRGFFPGWLNGVDHQQLVGGSFSSHRGEFAGVIKTVDKKSLTLATTLEIRPGMGLLFVGSHARSKEVGGFVYEANARNSEVTISMGKEFALGKLSVGDQVYINKDPTLVKKLEQTITNRDLLKRVPINLEVFVQEGRPIVLKVRVAGDEFQIQTDSFNPSAAINQATTREQLESTLSALTGSAFVVSSFQAKIMGEVFVPQKILKEIKRTMLQKLIELRTFRSVKINHDLTLERKVRPEIKLGPDLTFNLLVRSHQQLNDFIEKDISSGKGILSQIAKVILDYEFGKDYRQSLELLRQHSMKCFIATTRILKPGEYHNLNVIKRLAPDGVLIRNLGALDFFAKEQPDLELIGDFSLNVSNSLTFNYLQNKGLETLALSLDLNQWQMTQMLEQVDAECAEIFIHHHMPEFHMEHCVFAAFLSKGSSFKDCGKPCEKHKVALKDMYGHEHYLAADQECRNTMFKKTPISTLALLNEWQSAGAKIFRYEALWDSGELLHIKVELYLDVLMGRKEIDLALQELDTFEGLRGISLGQLNRKDSYISRKQS